MCAHTKLMPNSLVDCLAGRSLGLGKSSLALTFVHVCMRDAVLPSFHLLFASLLLYLFYVLHNILSFLCPGSFSESEHATIHATSVLEVNGPLHHQ